MHRWLREMLPGPGGLTAVLRDLESGVLTWSRELIGQTLSRFG
jgi:hypothetical protein